MRLMFVLCVLLVVSCASIRGGVDLHSLYNLYAKEIENKNYQVVANDFLSKKIKKDVMTQEGNSNFEDEFPILSTFTSTLVREIDNYQKITGNKGCLTINGFDSSSEPTSLNLEYVKEGGAWKLDYVQISYHESEMEFRKLATCPPRP